MFVRQIQSGYIYQYALFMLVGLFAFIFFRFFKMIHELPILSILIWLPILVGSVCLLVGAESNKKQYFLISISNITFILLYFIIVYFFNMIQQIFPSSLSKIIVDTKSRY